MNDYSAVPPYFKPVSDEEFEKTFLEDRKKVMAWVGPIFTQNVFDGQSTMPHDKLTTWLASWGMGLTSSSSFKSWTYDDHADKIKWERIVWRLFHIYPLGFLISRYKYYKLDYLGTWNPAVTSLDEYSSGGTVKMATSNRHISGACIAQAMYMKIFGEISDFEDNASISLALYDVFSATPNIDNPLFVTLRRAYKKTLYINPYPLPYFWNDFTLHLFGSIQSEYKEISHLVTVHDVNPNNFDIQESIFKDGDINPVTNEKPLDSPALKVDHAPLISSDEKLFTNVFGSLCSKLATGEYQFNGKGAVLHKIENHYFLVNPLWINKACEGNPDENIAEQILNYALDSNKILLYTGHIDIENKSGFPVHLALLSPALHKFLPDSVLIAQNNPDIRIVKKINTKMPESSH